MLVELGNKVTADVDTLYPFGDTLTTTIHADKAFTYFVRIPAWVSKGTISVNGARARAVSPSNGLHAVSVKAGTTKIVLNLPADITIGKYLYRSLEGQRRLTGLFSTQNLVLTVPSLFIVAPCTMHSTSHELKRSLHKMLKNHER